MLAQLLAAASDAMQQSAGGLPRSEEGKAERKKALLARHRSLLRDLQQQYYAPGNVTFQTTTAHHVKPTADFPNPPSIAACTPISIADMTPGVTHRGRVLKGRLLVPPVLMTGLGSLVEDEEGSVVQLGVYNLLPPRLQGAAGMQAGARALPEGRHVAILEPFFKVMADGALGLRVDNPKELVLLDSAPPSDAAPALLETARRDSAAGRYPEAAAALAAALLRLPDASGSGSDLLLSTLLNMSAAHQKLGSAAAALAAAAAAAVIQPAAAKPHFRAALALGQLGLDVAARAALHRSFGLMPGGGPSGDERKAMLTQLTEATGGAATTAPSPKLAARGRREAVRALAAGDGLLSAGGGGGSAGDGAAGGGDGGAVDVKAELAAAAAAKEDGNVHFKAGRYALALEAYARALAALRRGLPLAPVLLCELAAARLHAGGAVCGGGSSSGGDEQELAALEAACAAVVLAPGSPDAHRRQAAAALQLGWLAEAEAACQRGLAAEAAAAAGAGPQVAAAVVALRALRDRIQTAQAAAAASASSAAGSGPQPRASTRLYRHDSDRGSDDEDVDEQHDDEDERVVYGRERDIQDRMQPNTPVESTAMLNMMTRMLDLDPGLRARQRKMRSEKPLIWAAMQRDERVPPFHQDFDQAGRWPPGCDVPTARRLLWDAYELCVGIRRHLMAMAIPASNDPIEIMIKRVGELDPRVVSERLGFLTAAPPGAVRFRSVRASGYNPTIFHSFSNMPIVPVPMPPADPVGGGGGSPGVGGGGGARTHVAVGFVDLGSLAAALARPEWDAAVEAAERQLSETAAAAAPAATAAGGGGGGGGPVLVRWVGFEASPYAVAKTLVLERMLRSGGPGATEAAMQCGSLRPGPGTHSPPSVLPSPNS